MLVNYQAASSLDFWRNSSTSRTDTGGTACEVVFVESIEVLKSGTPFWYFMYSLSKWLLLVGVIGKVTLAFVPQQEVLP